MTIQDSEGARAARPGDARAADSPTVVVRATDAEVTAAVAREIADAVRADPEIVLGLATGGTMIGVYAELARLHAREGLDLSRVTTFNLDEYLGLAPGDERSFARFMDEHLFGPAGLDPARTHFPDAERARVDAHGAARSYEDAIAAAGGIELQLLGLGRNGHVAFNEPGSTETCRTRVVDLDATTRSDAAQAFGGLDAVPRRALTVGVATILEARKLRVLALGARKAEIVRRTLQDPIGPDVPATFLRRHGDAVLHLDAAAASLAGGR